jgi:hypothetical protein
MKFGNWEKIKRFELTPDIGLWRRAVDSNKTGNEKNSNGKIHLDLFHKIYN